VHEVGRVIEGLAALESIPRYTRVYFFAML
jgi:hypothetical protein